MTHLVELTLDFAANHLKPGGDLLVKVFHGEEYMTLRRELSQQFETVQVRKPGASRDRSPENYLLARGKKAAAA